MKKRAFLFLLMFTFTLMFLLVPPVSAAETADNSCGEGLSWSLSGGVLTVSGTGVMTDFDYMQLSPWHNSKASINKIVISDGVTHIGDDAFLGSAVRVVVLPETLKSVGGGAFSGCRNLEAITLPDSLESMGDSAFSGCTSLSSVGFGAGLEKIPSSAFSFCTSLGTVILPERITEIGDAAFADCTSLCKVTLPDALKRVGDAAFSRCSALAEITLPDGVTEIGTYAFSETSLSEITIPASVTTLGIDVFRNCTELCAIRVDENNADYSSDVTGILFDKSKKTLIRYPIGNTAAEYIIPDTVKKIENWAFYRGKNLSSVMIPDGTEHIGEYAFSECTALLSADIPASVTSIAAFAFLNCTALERFEVSPENFFYFSDENGVLFDADRKTLIQYPAGRTAESYTIPETVGSVANYAFCSSTSLRTVDIPTSIMSLSYSAFFGCSSITDFLVDENNGYLSSDERGAVFDKHKTEIILYPAGDTADAYILPDSVTRIGSLAFDGADSLTVVVLSPNTTVIASEAFRNCTSLSRIKLPSALKQIDNGAFYGCTSLIEIEIPEGVTYLWSNTFYGCHSLKKAVLPQSLSDIDTSAFSGCGSLSVYGTAGSRAQSFAAENRLIFIPGGASESKEIKLVIGSPEIWVNGVSDEIDVPAAIIDSRTMIPLRAIFEALGAEVSWDDAARTVTSQKGGVTVKLAVGDTKIYVNGIEKTLDVPAQIVNDRTLVPVRAVAESFGCSVGWIGETQTVIVLD